MTTFVALAIALTVAQPQAPADITKTAQLAIERLEKGEYAAVMQMFSVKLREKFPESKLKQTWESLHRRAGTLRSTHAPVIKTKNNLRHVVVPADFEKRKMEIEVVFNAAGEIAGLLLNRK